LELFTLAAERTGPVEVVDVDTFLSNEAVKRNRRVYFTQISSNEYAIGATMLACRLSRLNSTIPIVVLVDRPVSVDALAFLKSIPNTHLVRVTNPGRIASTKNETRVGTYNKLDAWRFENFAEVGVYLDADMIPLHDPLPLFDEFLGSKYKFGAVGTAEYFNSGMFVFKPSTLEYATLIRRLKEGNYKKNLNDPTEQDLLIGHFACGLKDSSEQKACLSSPPETTRFINTTWNFRRRQGNMKATIIHWIGNPKPWTKLLNRNSSIEDLRVDSIKFEPWFHKEFADALHDVLSGQCSSPLQGEYGLPGPQGAKGV